MFVDPPGRERNDFVHATNQLVIVMAWKLKLAVGKEEIIARPGVPGPSFHKALAA
jgi:hypothetical protein